MDKFYFQPEAKNLKLNFAVYKKYLNGSSIDMHTHDYDEITIVLNGTSDHLVNDKIYRLNAGDVFVIDKNACHSFENIDNLYHISISIKDISPLRYIGLDSLNGFNYLFLSNSLLKKSGEFVPHFTLMPDELNLCEHLADEILNEVSNGIPNYTPVVNSYFLALLAYLSRKYEKYCEDSYELYSQISKVSEYINLNFTNNITNSELAEVSNLSVRHLCRLFKQYTGLTPNQKIISLRLEKACNMLNFTKSNITEISEECGYTDLSFFTKQFKQYIGVSPLKYRRMLENT